ncbi:MAG: RNA methyltransferase [Bacteroidia bacterium]|nr:RNA methyltransferase [Bacteroidia bacterium]
MLSNNKIKYINSLKLKKYRDLNNIFIAEGEKIVSEALKSGIKIKLLISTNDWLEPQIINNAEEIIEVSEQELKRVSSLKIPNKTLALIEKQNYEIDEGAITENISMVFESVQDPGNLGTIIRIADWFGIPYIFCSLDCADTYNPKVVQASMGSIFRVKVFYFELKNWLEWWHKKNIIPIYGTFLHGSSIYEEELETSGLIVFGNESKGISLELERYITKKITIPGFPKHIKSSDSLNVSMAAAIVCSEFRRSSK